ncbi:protein ABHD14A isoform X3 [Meles meles]|uniref:protein ABHD14A isoform X3 n=1 Tax=Meles meles TaxID=9662 RepID=UPI001E6A015D|nr:protein ABHD14A isoform X3 [Meles meles]
MDLFLFKALLQFVGWHRRPEGVGVGVKNPFSGGGSRNAELGKALEFRPARNAEYPARHPLGPNALTHGHRRRGGSLGPLSRLRFWLAGPGFGNSAPSKEASTEAGRAELLERVLRDLEVHNAVLVSPSLSGRYALPFLIRGHHQLRGFVPIAPASTQNYTQEQFWAVKTPTLILYGELDRILARESLRQLRHLPNHSVVKLRDAGHACYLHKPQDFHLVLLAFLDRLP